MGITGIGVTLGGMARSHSQAMARQAARESVILGSHKPSSKCQQTADDWGRLQAATVGGLKLIGVEFLVVAMGVCPGMWQRSSLTFTHVYDALDFAMRSISLAAGDYQQFRLVNVDPI